MTEEKTRELGATETTITDEKTNKTKTSVYKDARGVEWAQKYRVIDGQLSGIAVGPPVKINDPHYVPDPGLTKDGKPGPMVTPPHVLRRLDVATVALVVLLIGTVGGLVALGIVK